MPSPPSAKRAPKLEPSVPTALAPQPVPATLPASAPTTGVQQPPVPAAPAAAAPSSHRKRKSMAANQPPANSEPVPPSSVPQAPPAAPELSTAAAEPVATSAEPRPKKSRTNTPWTPAEELRLKQMRDAQHSWSEIAKFFPLRTEGSVKKHWYKDMHYAEFAEDESAALLAAIKEYEANKWKVIGQKVGKPAKACEQYAKEHFGGKY